MGEADKDDSCSNCGSYNNEWVICDQCLKEVLRELGISEEKIEATVRKVTG